VEGGKPGKESPTEPEKIIEAPIVEQYRIIVDRY